MKGGDSREYEGPGRKSKIFQNLYNRYGPKILIIYRLTRASLDIGFSEIYFLKLIYSAVIADRSILIFSDFGKNHILVSSLYRSLSYIYRKKKFDKQ